MNEHLRERILRKLESLSDERGYHVLDYVEFLESKYAERQQPQNAFTRLSEAVEGRLRAGKVSATAIAETMGLLNRAANVLNGAVAAGRSVANDIVTAAQTVPRDPAIAPNPRGTTAASSSTAPPAPIASEASGPVRDVPRAASSEEHT
jgi:hypothetical protein